MLHFYGTSYVILHKYGICLHAVDQVPLMILPAWQVEKVLASCNLRPRHFQSQYGTKSVGIPM